MKSPVLTRIFSDDIEDMIERDLSKVRSSAYVLSIYFGNAEDPRQMASFAPKPLSLLLGSRSH